MSCNDLPRGWSARLLPWRTADGVDPVPPPPTHLPRRAPEDSTTSELDERRRGWKHCRCPIHLSGTLGGHFRRCSTDKVSWDDARRGDAFRSGGRVDE